MVEKTIFKLITRTIHFDNKNTNEIRTQKKYTDKKLPIDAKK